MSDLPKVFANKLEKDVGNNKTYSYDKSETMSVSQDRKSETITIHQKIKDIFNSPKYVYKADVVVEYDGIKHNKELIGYNRDYIITLNDEKIPISKIDDIYFK